MKRFLNKIICLLIGHKFKNSFYETEELMHCLRCGKARI
jgi:hypothetical protein